MDVDSVSPHSNSTSSSDDSRSQIHDEQHEQLVAQASQLAVSWVVDSVDGTALMQQSARDRAESRRARHREVQRRFAQRKKVLSCYLSVVGRSKALIFCSWYL